MSHGGFQLKKSPHHSPFFREDFTSWKSTLVYPISLFHTRTSRPENPPWFIQLAFFTQAKIRHFWVLSEAITEFRLVEQREELLFTVAYLAQLSTVLRSSISWCLSSRISNSWLYAKNGGKIQRIGTDVKKAYLLAVWTGLPWYQ